METPIHFVCSRAVTPTPIKHKTTSLPKEYCLRPWSTHLFVERNEPQDTQSGQNARNAEIRSTIETTLEIRRQDLVKREAVCIRMTA